MSSFVNYSKRSYTLPAGCKDLIDLLPVPADAATPSSREAAAVTRGHQALGASSEVRNYVARLVESASDLFTLMISTSDERFTVLVYRQEETLMCVLLLPGDEAEWEGRVREFFRVSSVEPLQEHSVTGDAEAGIARSFTYPLPSTAPEAAQVIVQLFRDVCGPPEASFLRFRAYEGPDSE